MTTVIRDGDFEATVNLDELTAQLQRAGMGAESAILEDFERRRARIFGIAHQAWPVATGRSKAAITHSAGISRDGSVFFSVGNTADYARFIRSNQIERAVYKLRPDGIRYRQRGTATAMWALLRWPEAWHAKDALRVLRDKIERALSREVAR